MKISMSGRYTAHEFAEALDRVIQNLTANGADEFRAATLYINAYRKKRHLSLTDERTGERIEHLQYDGPFARPFKPISPRITIVEPQPKNDRPE